MQSDATYGTLITNIHYRLTQSIPQTKFEVDAVYLQKFNIENVGGAIHNELWIHSEELEEFHKHIVGKIEMIAKHE